MSTTMAGCGGAIKVMGRAACAASGIDGEATGRALRHEEWRGIWACCFRRIRRWRSPPRWSPREWWEEAHAQAAASACQALRDYDPARGVPLAAFVRRRALDGVWTLYRREWRYGIRNGASALVEDLASPAEAPPTRGSLSEIHRLVEQLGERERWLIRQCFWADLSDSSMAEALGISRQAVNKRRRSALRTLRRALEKIA